MKITELTTHAVPPHWQFLKVETDEGAVGWASRRWLDARHTRLRERGID